VARLEYSQNSREFIPEQNDAGLKSISNGSKALAFSNVGLQKFKMAV
jgi:hypothetical protein